MIKKALHGLVVAFGILVLPAALRPAILKTPHIWIMVVLAVMASVLQPSYRAFERSRNKWDQGTATQIIWTVYLTQLFALLEASLLRYPESFVFDWISVCALVCTVGGILLRAWGVRVLGRYFTWSVQIVEGQEIIQRGPYHLIRHPGYVGPIITYTMSAVFVHAWYSAAFALIALTAVYLRRIRLEEALLKQHFPEYVAYTQRTKALIPWVY